MKNNRGSELLMTAVILMAGAYFQGCHPDAGPTEPLGGGYRNFPIGCPRSSTYSWDHNSLDIMVSKPPCPVPIQSAYNYVDYMGQVTAPASKIEFQYSDGPPLSYIDVDLDNYDGFADHGPIGQSYFNYMQQDAGNANSYYTTISFSAPPGLYPIYGDNTRFLDSLAAEALWFSYAGTSKAGQLMPGTITTGRQNLLGETNVVAGGTALMRSQPEWDTSGYTFKWLADGNEVAGATGAQYLSSFANAGTHQLANVTIRADNTADTVSTSVTVLLSVAITGPSQVVENVSSHWDAAAYGGSSYQYQWYVDYSTAGGNQSYLDVALGPGGTNHRITVTVTDGNGHSNSSDLDVYAQYADCPSCQPYTRILPSVAPIKSARKR